MGLSITYSLGQLGGMGLIFHIRPWIVTPISGTRGEGTAPVATACPEDH